MRLRLPAPLLLLVPALLSAQTYTAIQFAHTQSYTQTDLSTVIASDTDGDPATTNYYHFFAGWQGTGLNFVPPDGHGYPANIIAHADTGTFYDPVTASSSTTQPTLIVWEWDFASQAALTTAMPNGNWTGSVVFRTGPESSLGLSIPTVTLAGNLYPNTPSVASLSQGTFNAGTLLIDPTAPLALASNIFAANFAAGSTRISLQIEDNFGNRVVDQLTTTADALSYTAPVGTFVAGRDYLLKLEFDRLSDTATHDFGSDWIRYTGGPTDVEALYSTYTTLSISAIPEPATYATILAALALAATVCRRRHAATRR